jgi:hypothetical protein
MVWGNGRWIGFDAFRSIVTSTDRFQWQRTNAGIPFDAKAAVWTGTKFVAVGGSGATMSTDGTHWQSVTVSGLSNDLELSSLVWTGSHFIASENGGRLFTSPDGGSWSRVNFDPSTGFSSLLSVNGTLVASIGGQLTTDYVGVSSDEGKTWKLSGLIADSIKACGMTWDGRRFVRLCGANMATSPDGLTWTVTPTSMGTQLSGSLGLYGLRRIFWTGSRYLASNLRDVPGLIAAGTITVSGDAIHWNEVNAGDFQTLNGFAQSPSGVLAFGQLVLQGGDGKSWAIRLPSSGQGAAAPTWSVDRLVFVDGTSWTAQSVTSQLTDLEWNGQRLVPIGPGKALTSTKGTTWTTATFDASTARVLWDGTRFTAFDPLRVYTSADGSSWSTRGAIAGSYQAPSSQSLSHSHNVFVGCSDFPGRLSFSTNGLVWSPFSDVNTRMAPTGPRRAPRGSCRSTAIGTSAREAIHDQMRRTGDGRSECGQR